MTPDDRLLDDLAEAFLDGSPIDWAAAEGTASAPLVTQLRIVAGVAEAHRQSPVSSLADPTTTATTASPEAWGHLHVRERIGRGAFGEVYRAWDTRLDREVALKLIPAADAAASGNASIIHEGRLLARVRHPNVVTIYGADQIGEHVGLWMELVPGRTLEELLQSGETFAPAEVVRIGIELCSALAVVHTAGLLHRDIKAQNVMRADDGRIVMMDFGTGRDLADQESDLTGTPLYLAPEILQGRPATRQSDIYSLGVLLYHLLTRSYPIHGRTIHEIHVAHRVRSRVNVRVVRRDLSSQLARSIERAIDPLPGHRYPTADMLGGELEKIRRTAPDRGWRQSPWAAATVLVAAAWLVRESALLREPSRTGPSAYSTMSAPGASPPASGDQPFTASPKEAGDTGPQANRSAPDRAALLALGAQTRLSPVTVTVGAPNGARAAGGDENVSPLVMENEQRRMRIAIGRSATSIERNTKQAVPRLLPLVSVAGESDVLRASPAWGYFSATSFKAAPLRDEEVEEFGGRVQIRQSPPLPALAVPEPVDSGTMGSDGRQNH